MANRYRKRSGKKQTWFQTWGWLLISASGTILFGFGLLEVSKYYNLNPLWITLAGAVITGIAIYMKKFTTETAVATKRR